MAKVKLSSNYSEINGRINDVVYYNRNGVQCMRRYVVPVNPDTEEQRVHRSCFKNAVKKWSLLSPEEKGVYRLRADELKLNMSGYNLFISECMKQNKNNAAN